MCTYVLARMLYYYELYYSGAWTQQQQRDYDYIPYMGRNGVSFLQNRGFFAVWLFRMSLLLPSSIFVLPEAKVPLHSHNCDD